MHKDLDNFRRNHSKPAANAVDGFHANLRSYQHGSTSLIKLHISPDPISRVRVALGRVPRLAESLQPGTFPLDMSLPGALSRVRTHPVFGSRRLRSMRIWGLRVAIAFMVITIGGGSLLATLNYWKLSKVFGGHGETAAALRTDVKPELLGGEGSGRINLLLLGNGGGTHDAPDLTDTMIVASIDPVTYRADLVSVPRDLWVKVDGYGSMKINAVYETGKYAYLHKIDNSNANHGAVNAGMDMADRTVEQVLGVTINYNVLVNFQAFRQAVDILGGVTVDVPEDLYDPTMAWENAWNPLLAKAGMQNFDGKHALIYARSRETTSDFARGQRQRSLLMAIKDKVLTLGTLSNPIKISQLVGAFGDNAQTDLSIDDMRRLATVAKGIQNGNIQSVGLTDESHKFVTTDHVGGQSVVRPIAGFSSYDTIQKYIRGILVDGYIAKEKARIMVVDSGSAANLAIAKAEELKTYGYNIVASDVVPSAQYSKTTIIDLTHGKDKYTSHYLEQRFGVKPISASSDKAMQTAHADFIIILR